MDDLNSIWSDRSAFYGGLHRVMDDLVGVYHGSLPPEFDDFFHEEMHRHVINQVRLAWDDLANLAGKEFPIYVYPDNNTPTAKDRAELQERVGYWYNRAGSQIGGLDMKLMMKVLMWWFVGVGEAVPMVLPSYDLHSPFFTFRDPRTHYPPVGWTPYNQTAPDDTMFAYVLTIGELKRRYPDLSDEIDRKLARTRSSPGTKNSTLTTKVTDSSVVWMAEYYHADSWQVQTLSDQVIQLARSDQGDPGHPNVMPVVPMALYSPGSPKGRSVFADQISIQAAMARMFSQKLDYYDRMLYPIIFTTPLSDEAVQIGPMAINEWDPTQSGIQPKVDKIAPDNTIDADQMMSFVLGLSRMLNRNPEQMQGQGPANSAKALNELSSAINSTVRDMFWPPVIHALPTLYRKAAEMDIALWGSESKQAHGVRKNEQFSVAYRPNVNLRGREALFQVEPGVGLAGYQGTLEILQLVGAELMAEDTALELLEHIREPQREKRRIQGDRMEKLEWVDLQAKAGQGLLAQGSLAKLRRLTDAGTDLFDALEQLEDAGQLLAPPPPALPGMPGAPPGQAPGAPPEAPGIPGSTNPGEGPPASFLPLPTLNALRGGPLRARPAGNPSA